MTSVQRPSIVDVFENFLLDDITRVDDGTLKKLSSKEQDELADRIDEFLVAAQTDQFADDAVVMDGFASPIILSNDTSLPRTTRRAKQVALAHTEIIFPLEEYGLAHRELGISRLVSFFAWVKSNTPLLRSHVFSLAAAPSPLDLISADTMMEIIDEGRGEDHRKALADAYSSLNGDRLLSCLEDLGEIGALIAATLQDGAASGRFAADLSFTHVPSGAMFRSLMETSTREGDEALFRHARMLNDLELPAIDDLRDEDFVLIRDEAEDFDAFRSTLSRSLKETEDKIERGVELDEAFNASLDEVRWRAELLREKTSERGLFGFMKEQGQGVAMGTVMTSAAAAAASPFVLASAPLVAAQAGAALAAGALFALMTFRSPKREQRLLRFYDVLLSHS